MVPAHGRLLVAPRSPRRDEEGCTVAGAKLPLGDRPLWQRFGSNFGWTVSRTCGACTFTWVFADDDAPLDTCRKRAPS
jgi:hypothetical protein